MTLLTASSRPGAAYVEDPAPGHTGGFGEPTCQACHFGEALNDPAGALRVEGVPERAEPGATHRLTVVLAHPGLQRGGFQLSVRLTDGTQAGGLESVDARSRVTRADGTSLAYAHHTPEGTQTQAPGTLRWEFRWTAPSEPSGRVLFHVTANASNDDDSPFGDSIYSAAAETVVR
ncbi:MAG: choice-of-anchor V domain-containing protein [Thermoanaerobaculia bacterium]